MASTISFGGKVHALPGAYSKVDASGLSVPALGAAGIVAMLDLAVGGKPYTAITDPDHWPTASTSAEVLAQFKDGDLREVSALMFEPSTDPDIPSGAQQLVLVKVNPAVQSAATFANVDGAALTLTSDDYGLFTTQIHVTIATGTDGGKKVLIDFEGTEELFDDIGITGKFTIGYTGGAGKATAATVTTSIAGVQLDLVRSDAGLDTGFTQPAPGSTLEAVSSNAGDTTQTITVFGLDGANLPQTSGTIALNGTTPVAIGAFQWNLVTASTLSAVTAGNVTLRISGVGATVVVFTAAQVTKGRVALSIPQVDGTISVKADAGTTKKLVIRGTDATGAVKTTAVTLNGATPVVVAAGFATLTAYELGNVEAARTVSLTFAALKANKASFPNLQKVKDKVATMSDFAFVSLIGNPKSMNVVDLDYVTATNILNTTATIFGVLFDMIATVNATSLLVTATRANNATGAPTNTSAAVYLTGGHEGDALNPGVPTATNTDWQNALDKTRDIFINTVWVGATDAAVHAMLDAHCAFMCGDGKQERDGFAGAVANETFTALKTRALNLNTRHVRLAGQEVKLFDIAGDSVWQPPKYQAALGAAMQAGAAEVGTPLTHKFVSVQGVRQHSSWNPLNNGDAAIQAGLWIMERVPSKGIRVVRNVTTYLIDNNPAFVEGSMNQEVDFLSFNLRSELEKVVGKKGLPKTVNAAKANAIRVLDQMMRDGIIVAYKAPVITLDGDALLVDAEVAPTSPINFVPITAHLARATFAAAA